MRKLAEKYLEKHAVRHSDVVGEGCGVGGDQSRKWLPQAILRAALLGTKPGLMDHMRI